MGAKIQELAKRTGLKLNAKLDKIGTPARFAQGASEAVLRKDQRKRDAAAGLVPFACKLPMALIAQVQARAGAHEGGLNAWVQAALESQLKKKA